METVGLIGLSKDSYNNQVRHFLKGTSASFLVDCFIEGVEDGGHKKIINSIVDTAKGNLLYQWKIKIADEASKSKNMVSIAKPVAISLTFLFHRPFRNKQGFDIDNFIKPVIDGLAKGLFSKDWDKEKNQGKVHFNEDDSIFRNIYLERLDTEEPKEGIYITIWEI